MGEDVVGAGEPTRLPGHLNQLTWETFSDHILATYEVGDQFAVDDLIEQLDGFVMRDQRLPAEFSTASDQRKALHRYAKTIKHEASRSVPDIRRLRIALEGFERAIEPTNWSAVMLHEVFDIPYIASTAMEPPEPFDALREALMISATIGNENRPHLAALSELPVRQRMRTNVVRNHALEQALIACRNFWLLHSPQRGWSRSVLSHPETLKSYAPHELVGPCERFVVDMLTASGVEFTLRSLNGAWSALDKRLAAKRDNKLA